MCIGYHRSNEMVYNKNAWKATKKGTGTDEMKTEIIYEDEAIIILRKPAGLAVQTARLGQADCVSELKNYLHESQGAEGEPYLGVVHRLDQPVEGLLVFAKTRAAAALLSAQLKECSLHKSYEAAAYDAKVQNGQGKTEEKDSGSRIEIRDANWCFLKDFMMKDDKSGCARIGSGPQAKEARLRFRITGRNGELVRLEVELETGRFHQIRAQMSYHGFPLLGDQKYGTSESKLLSSRHGIRNPALCAYRLELEHPVTGRREAWECRPQNPAFQLF